MKMTDSININAPIERVFECIADQEQQKLWVDGLVGIEYTSEWKEDNPVGTQFKQRLLKGPKKVEYEFEGEILAYQNPKLFGTRIGDNLVCYPFRAPECIKLNAAIFRFTLVLSDLNVFT